MDKRIKDNITQRIPLINSEMQHEHKVFQQYGEINTSRNTMIHATTHITVLITFVYEGPRTEEDTSPTCTYRKEPQILSTISF